MRLLWLTYERPPHPDAVLSPVNSHDADFVIALLQHPYERRMHFTRQLSAYLSRYEHRPPMDRPAVPCRTPSGLYHLVPWRLAKWLRHVLPAQESVVDRTVTRIRSWQSAGLHPAAMNVEC